MADEDKKEATATATNEKPAGKKHKVTFLPLNVTIEVDEADYPYGDHGLGGSLLDIALKHNIRLEHNCGGNCACTTCHVIVKEGVENLSKMQADEEDRLDMAEGLTLTSRLGCQAVVRGDVVVEIPD
ncbi:MAG: 2Fe-2S iron-sulfur cluster-binding protein [Nitrospirota bacterium]